MFVMKYMERGSREKAANPLSSMIVDFFLSREAIFLFSEKKTLLDTSLVKGITAFCISLFTLFETYGHQIWTILCKAVKRIKK